MRVEFLDKKIIHSHNTDAKIGSFALDVSPLKFENCRERFAKYWDESTTGWFLKHPENKGKDIASFLVKTEYILKQKEFSKFSDTNRDSILWIEPSEFWKSCRLRRSLLTIIVRAGMFYDLKNDNYEDALFSQEYVTPTKRAVQRFLFGFTKYVGTDMDNNSSLEKKGWKTIFEGKDTEAIKSILVWPEDEDLYSPVFQEKGAIWF
jgi:hypothetical protein